MGQIPRNLRGFDRLRLEETRVATDLNATHVSIRDSQRELDELVRTGATGRETRAVLTRLERLGRQRDLLKDRLDRVRDRITDTSVVQPLPAGDTAIPGTRADTPVLMLPVRLETRYVGGDLLVRIFPDQVHVDAHEPELTADEVAAGQHYWNQRWPAADAAADVEAGRAAFGQLAQRFRPRRAAWIVLAMTPANLAPPPRAGAPAFPQPASRPTAWSRAAHATLLPTRWTVVGLAADGRELFRKTGAPVPDRLNTGPDPNDTSVPPVDANGVATALPIDPGLKWTVDFATAEAAGMALRIGAGDVAAGFNIAADTIARLVAFGINTTLSPAQAAARLEALLRAHVHADGLAVLQPGTPTNNDGSSDAGFSTDEALLTAAMDPSVPPSAPAGAARLAGLLGINAGAAHLDRIAWGGDDADVAGHMVNATWSATLGHTLDQLLDPQLDDAAIARVRDHAVRWLRPGGPLPAVRVGRQPYGLLPVMAPQGHVPLADDERHLANVVDKLRGYWTLGAEKVPRLDTPGGNLTDNMEKLLQHAPLATTSRFRRAYGPQLKANSNADPALAATQEMVRGWTLASLGITRAVKLATLTLEARNHRLNAPFVQARIPDTVSRLAPDYLTAIADLAVTDGGRPALVQRGNADTLLEALAANAVLYEFDRAATTILLREQVDRGIMARMPARAALRVDELIGIEDVALPQAVRGSPAPLAVTNPRVQADLILPERTGRRPLAAYLVDQIITRGRDADAAAALVATTDSLRALAARPAAEIDRLFRGVLDAYSHRLDPWLTSLATRRLAHWRAQPGSQGISIGGFGWVEGLKPDARPDSEGYIHAPSLQHAQTAAVLRSGHLAQRDASATALSIDLSSRRVRLALGLLDGAAQGQPMAALLGYRLERRLRETDLTLAQFILPLRRLFPLRPPPGQTVLGQSEAIAARDVVDGVKLLDRRRAGGNWLQGLSPAPDAAQKGKIEAVVAELDDMFDAVSDLLVAEGVHQLVGGNMERAGAALAAMDRQAVPVDPEVVRTPRSGRAFAQRLCVVLTDEDAGPDWPVDARALAEPRVNAWVARLLGAPDRISFVAHVVGPGDLSRRRPLDPVSLADLKLSPLTLLMLAAPGGRDRPSELQQLLAARFAQQVTDAERQADTALELLPDTPRRARMGLGALEALLDRMRRVVTGHRPMTALDIAPPGTLTDPGGDGGVLADRADAVRTALKQALTGLETALGAAPPDAATVDAALLDLARAGASGVVPGVVGDDVQLELARQAIDRVLERLDQESALTPPAGASAEQLVEHGTARLKALLGASFPVLPPFALPAPLLKEAMASLADRKALIGTDASVLHGWLVRMGEVKPRAGELAQCLAAADMLAGTTADLGVAQFPHRPGARWIGLPLGANTPAEVNLSLTLHAPGLDAGAPPAAFAGLVCDDWTEVIPSATETTAIAFHYDAPGARPPQCLLIGVHPGNAAAAGWTPNQLLATVNEAREQARMRAVRPQDLDVVGGLLPLIYLPDNYTRDVPGIDFRRLAEVSGMARAAAIRGVLGKV